MKNGSNTEVKLARVLEYQRALAAFSRLASEALPPERLMHHACVQVSRVTHIKRTKVLRYRPNNGDLLVVACASTSAFTASWVSGLVSFSRVLASRTRACSTSTSRAFTSVSTDFTAISATPPRC
jgi:hypothetical protein